MSLLNSLFNRGTLGTKCKTLLKLAISRINLLRNKREVQLKQMRKEIAQFLQTGQEAIARIRVEHAIREQNILAAYEILELFCEFVLVRVPMIETQKECPWELQEAIASIIFSAPRCSDLPELMHIQNLFTIKYGKEFASAAAELRPQSNVNRSIIEKLSVRAPSAEVKLKTLLEIAKVYNLEWDPSATEQELCKKNEDLLDGSSHVRNKAEDTTLKSPSTTSRDGPATVPAPRECSDKELIPSEKIEQGTPKHQASNTVQSAFGPIKNEVMASDRTFIQPESRTQSESSDVFEVARVAIASAERAAAAARAAANLASLSLSPAPGNRSPSGLGTASHAE